MSNIQPRRTNLTDMIFMLHFQEDAKDLTVLDTTKSVCERLYKNTGRSVNDLGVAEVHDCFAIAELMMYEAMGLTAYGEGAKAAREGVTRLEGKLPVNTGGGLMAFGHPVSFFLFV